MPKKSTDGDGSKKIRGFPADETAVDITIGDALLLSSIPYYANAEASYFFFTGSCFVV